MRGRDWSLKIFLLAGMGLTSCTGFSSTGGPGKNVPARLQARVESPAELLTVNTLLVAPISIDLRLPKGPDLRAPFPFHNELERTLASNSKFELLSGDEVLKLFRSENNELIAMERAIDVGRQLHADGILFTRVTRYQERQGSAVGASEPAAVTFRMRLVRLSDKKELWEASYHFQDIALSDNLLRLPDRLKRKERPGWKTAREALEQGFREAVVDLSSRRNARFTAQNP